MYYCQLTLLHIDTHTYTERELGFQFSFPISFLSQCGFTLIELLSYPISSLSHPISSLSHPVSTCLIPSQPVSPHLIPVLPHLNLSHVWSHLNLSHCHLIIPVTSSPSYSFLISILLSPSHPYYIPVLYPPNPHRFSFHLSQILASSLSNPHLIPSNPCPTSSQPVSPPHLIPSHCHLIQQFETKSCSG